MIPGIPATIAKTLLFCASLIACSAPLYAQVFLSEDFDSAPGPGLPGGWTSQPESQWMTGSPNTLAPNASAALNFSLNTPAHTRALGIDGSQAAADAAQISAPLLSLPASAVNTVLTFDIAYFGLQSDNTPPETEGLIFMISTDGGATWSDVSFVAPLTNPANSVWDSRSIPLGMYAGEHNLKFGFRYHNQGGYLVGAVLDNIRVVNGMDGIVVSALAGDHPDPSTSLGYQLAGTLTRLTGTVRNMGASSINNYYIKYQVGNAAVQSSSLVSTPVSPLATADFPAGLSVLIPANGDYTIKAWIEAPGDADRTNDTFFTTTVGVPRIPVKRPVFEEGTGTWCGWCPRGTVYMDQFAAGHPKGVAAQIAVHNNDPMTVIPYTGHMKNYAGGFPNLVIDRTMEKDPMLIDSAFSVARYNFGFADVAMDTPVISGDSVFVPITIKPVVNIQQPRLALVITESGVTGSGRNWAQTNYYAGGGSGAMGGWENKPDHVDGVHFDFVARSITPSPEGDAGTLPATLSAGGTYNTVLSAKLDTGWKRNELRYIALLINGNNTSIMNSVSSDNLAPRDTAVHIGRSMLFPNPASDHCYLGINLTEDASVVITVHDITGRQMLGETRQLKAGDNRLDMDTRHFAPGNYIVKTATEKDKLVFRLTMVR